MPGLVADPYMVALIAVAGTIVGGLIASITQVVTSRSMRRAQVRMLDSQAAHATEQALREQRREVYVRFILNLDAMAELRGRCLGHHKSDGKRPLPSGKELDEVNRRSLEIGRELDLLSNERIETLAYALRNHSAARMFAAFAGEALPDSPPGVTYAALVSAMRMELGVSGGRQPDPQTGIYALRRPTLPPSP